MVAFATEYMTVESPARSQNRAECFFARVPGRVGHGAPAVRLNAGEKSSCRYDACRGASLAHGGQSVRERTDSILARAENGVLSTDDSMEIMSVAAESARGSIFKRFKLFWNHASRWAPFDFVVRTPNMTFQVPNPFSGETMALNPGEFGNLVAGYAGFAALGDPGVSAMMLGGDFFSAVIAGNGLDSPSSTIMINYGRHLGTQNFSTPKPISTQFNLFQRHLPDLLEAF